MDEGAGPREYERRTSVLPSVIEKLPPSPWRKELQPLLAIGPWTGGEVLRVAAGGGERWLVHMGSLIKDRLDVRAIDAFEVRASADGQPLARLVRKGVWDVPEDPKDSLTSEGLFYGGPALALTGSKFRLPRLHACASTERGVSLVLEHVPGSTGRQNWATVQRLAEALGEFGARSRAKGICDSPLVKPLGPGFQLETADNLLRMAELCLPPGGRVAELLDAFFLVFSDPNLLQRIRERLCPCICHDDAFRRNMLAPDGEDTTVIIDWGKVRSGFIGHDASLLLLPGMVGSRRLRRGVNFEQAAGRVFRALWTGVDGVGTGLARESVRLGFDFALLHGIARFSDRHAATLTGLNSNANAEELMARRQWMISVLDFGRRKAEDLARRFG